MTRINHPADTVTKTGNETLFGVPLPENDSAEAIAREISEIETRLDAAIAKINKVLAQ